MRAAGVALALVLTLLMPTVPARADEDYEGVIYATCQRLGSHPWSAAVYATVDDLLAVGYTPEQTASILVYGVAAICPELLPVVRRAFATHERIMT